MESLAILLRQSEHNSHIMEAILEVPSLPAALSGRRDAFKLTPVKRLPGPDRAPHASGLGSPTAFGVERCAGSETDTAARKDSGRPPAELA